MLKMIGKNLLVGAVTFFVFWLVQMPSPQVFMLPVGFVVAGVGSDIVRARRKGALPSLVIALGIVAVVFLVVWMLQISLLDMLVYITVIFVVVFFSEFVPRKKEAIQD